MGKNFLNRYTSLPFLLDTLYYKRLTLLDPITWDDKNDSYFLELYKNSLKLKTVLALCFTENKYQKYHHWKVYSGNSSGICIQFDKDELIRCYESISGVRYNSVSYKTIAELTKDQQLGCKDMPFIKRKAFSDEKEFRFIYQSNVEEIQSKVVSIELSSILKITFNPWIHESVYKSVSKVIRGIEGCKGIKMAQTRLLSYEKWRIVGKEIAAKFR